MLTKLRETHGRRARSWKRPWRTRRRAANSGGCPSCTAASGRSTTVRAEKVPIRRAVDLATAQGAWSLALRAAISLALRSPSERATLRAVLDAVPEPARRDRLEAEAVLAGSVGHGRTNAGANASRTIDVPASPPMSR